MGKTRKVEVFPNRSKEIVRVSGLDERCASKFLNDLEIFIKHTLNRIGLSPSKKELFVHDEIDPDTEKREAGERVGLIVGFIMASSCEGRGERRWHSEVFGGSSALRIGTVGELLRDIED